MRSPKGFGKTYFTLATICAHAVAPVLAANTSRTVARRFALCPDDAEETPEDEPLEALLAGCAVSETAEGASGTKRFFDASSFSFFSPAFFLHFTTKGHL